MSAVLHEVFSQMSETGDLYIWDTRSLINHTVPFGTPDLAYTIEDKADFNGDGKTDLLFFNRANGQVGFDDTFLNWHRLDPLNSSWEVSSHNGPSDFYRDGSDDILWRNTSNGELVIWDMLNGQKADVHSLGKTPLAWQVIGTSDFNGDGTDDILWQNSATGEIREWLLQNGAVVSNIHVDTVSPNHHWAILGVGDFTNDGSADILWRNSSTNEVLSWNIDNGQHTSSQHLDYLPANWRMAEIVQVNDDGTSDIIWHDSNAGYVVQWLMSDGSDTATRIGQTPDDIHFV